MLPYGWFGFFLFAPLILLLGISLSEAQLGSPPYTNLWTWSQNCVLQVRLSFANYASIFAKPLYSQAYLNSFKIAASSTVFCLLLGYPMAYRITRFSKKGQIFWMILLILPFLTSFLVRMCAWMNILSYQGLINHILQWFHIRPLHLMDNQTAIIIGMVYSYLPFMVFPIYANLEKTDRSLLEAAYNLGARPWKTFWKITLPLSYPGILAGSSLVFIPAMGEYVIPELLGGTSCITVGRLLWYEFFINHDWPTAAALAFVMIVLLLIPIILFEKIQSRIERSMDINNHR